MTCSYCGNDVSPEATTCPACGHRSMSRSHTGCLAWGVGAFIGLMAAGILLDFVPGIVAVAIGFGLCVGFVKLIQIQDA